MKIKFIKFLGLVFFLPFSTLLISQEDTPPAFWKNTITKDFKTIQQETEAYFEGKDKGRGSGYKQWKRWEYFNQFRLTPEGQITNHISRNNLESAKFRKQNPNSRQVLNQWETWGDNNYVLNGFLPGTGVLNCVAFHPTDPNILFTGGPATGLWKTTNNGQTWTNLTDSSPLDIRGISSIAVNHVDPNIIYILTGDGDGKDTPSTGIYKTLDGGSTWIPTSLTWGPSDLKFGFKLAMNPVNPDILLAATTDGIYHTSDGFTWTQVETGLFYDIVYAPGSQLTIYASNVNQVFRSVDAGFTWAFNHVIPLSERVQLAVSPQNPNLVYALGGGYVEWPNDHGFPGFYVSDDLGDNWNLHSLDPAICSYDDANGNFGEQVPYDLDFAVNPSDPSQVVMGAINVYGSVDTGKVWTLRALWYDADTINKFVHADIHGIEYNPLNNKLYICCDGGIYVSNDNGFTFADITIGMQLNQFYDVAETPQNSNFMLGGLYHNGSRKFTGASTAPTIRGGDGTACLIDPRNIDTMFYSSQYGNIQRSYDGGNSDLNITPNGDANGPFFTPLAINPVNPNTIYAGWRKDTIWRSTNQGDTWTNYDLGGLGNTVTSINVSSDGLSMFATTYERVFHSTDGGINWSTIYTSGDSFTKALAVSPTSCFITRGGYDSNDKVYYYTTSGGINNISYNLPNVPINTVAVNTNVAPFEVYIGTDIGVFKHIFGTNSWTSFNNGLPATVVTDLVVYPNHSILRAATFGRGLWQVDIPCSLTLFLTQANDPNNDVPVFQYNEASTSLFTSRKVTGSTGDVTYKAGNVVILEDGFRATEGNKVLVGTNVCGQGLN